MLNPRFDATHAGCFAKAGFYLMAMRQEHITEDEIRAATRQQGVREVGQVHVVILEINGSFAVLRDRGNRSSLLQVVIDA